jgi:hypothetical protein
MTARATRWVGVVAIVAVGGSSAVARAQDETSTSPPRFGERSRVVVSVENVVGGFSESISQSSGDQGSNSLNANGFFAGFTGPRYGVSVFLPKNFTVGTGLGLWWLKDTTNASQTTTTRVLRIAPRIGWAPTFGRALNVWLRAGVTYLALEPASLRFVDVSAEAFIVYAPLPHFGVLVGPSLDLPISGKSATASDLRFQSIGVAAGLFADF